MYIVDLHNRETNTIEKQYKFETAQETFAKAMELRSTFCTGDHTHYIEIWRDDIDMEANECNSQKQ